MARRPDVVIAMPAFNEELTVPSFLAEISDAFEGLDFRLVVVNDCSTDGTEKTLLALTTIYPLEVETNSKNLGHGPSTIKALRLAAKLDSHYVVATDGDGHVTGSTLRMLYNQATNCDTPTVIEGSRTQRDDPWFRKAVSAATRMLVRLHSGTPPQDANTPFRVYPAETLNKLLSDIPAKHMTPNLIMSTLVRRHSLPFREIPITPHKREGGIENGSTWKQRFRVVPSRRFLEFCFKATGQWIFPGKKK